MARYSEALEPTPVPQRGSGFWRFLRYLSSISLGLMVLLFAAIVLWPYVVITVPRAGRRPLEAIQRF